VLEPCGFIAQDNYDTRCSGVAHPSLQNLDKAYKHHAVTKSAANVPPQIISMVLQNNELVIGLQMRKIFDEQQCL
jgi:hypothetical protein